ncbi:peptidase M16 [Arenicella chitinivorans]|uniref:Peptidase M16 n=1 Tax=Arenicella chitinivorans TaxID=1329800 RepID=A0A918VIZ4_9GAMM|nr:pitrilysin family protein [Arenicella chitinivorans]GGZ99966.1 peptidase M16 [Arenicella chitinivorans]
MTIKKSLHHFIWLAALALLAPAMAANEDLDIPYTKYTLDNGLTLIVHEDHKAPIVAVNVWYHVGSKDEKVGRTGFAHLFEHLMFNGSENYDDEWFKALDRAGATGINGTTNQDRTNYYQVVPKNALEMTLWLESDRMGHLLGAVTQEKLDEQRSVVQNEKRQRENQPYGKAFSTIFENAYPIGHPYSWPVIGSMEDLDSASLDDVHEWFKTRYGASNATITLAGDVDPEQAKTLVEKYFGDIEPGPPLVRHKKWVAKRRGQREQTMYDRVPQARLYKIWNVPEWGSAEADYLDLASGVLSNDKESRLYKRLVYQDRLASDIQAFSFNSEIGGLFGVIVTALEAEKLDQIDQIIDQELATFLAKGPSKDELERVKSSARASYLRSLERVATKADILAKHQVFTGSLETMSAHNKRYLEATAEQVQNTARAWLSDGEYKLRVVPFPTLASKPSTVDRSAGLPSPGTPPVVAFDTIQHATLSNGLKVRLAERHDVPVVRMELLVDAGYAADRTVKPGTANMTMNMLDEGTAKFSALDISARLARMGTGISSGASLDSCSVNLNTLTEHLEPSLEIYADMILHPNFPEAELDRLKQRQLAAIAQEKNTPIGAGLRLLPTLLYGADHAYAAPFSGSGTEQSVEQMTVADLAQYHQTWFKANNATLVVTGDISMEKLVPLLEGSLAKLPTGEVPTKDISRIAPLTEPVVYLVDRPGAEQSVIFATSMVPEYGFDDELPLSMMNEVLGASFTSRINMNLREDKGWSYGARSVIRSTQSERPYIAYAPVQKDQTAASMLEIRNELASIQSDRPATDDELAAALDKRILTLPGRWETAGAVEADLTAMVRYDLADDYWDNYVNDLRALNLQQINDAAKQYLQPNAMLWLVVGDRASIEQSVRDAGLGKVIVLNAEGEPVTDATAINAE